MTKQSGQALIILLLATLVALTIGLTITQRTLTDVSTSSKIEQTSRAFSAAEGGLGYVIGANPNPAPFSTTVPNSEFGNQSQADVTSTGLVPIGSDKGLEYPPIDKTAFAIFWLADPVTLNQVYDKSTLDIYFGNATQNPTLPETMPAIEVNLITDDGTKYTSTRYYIDSITTPSPRNNFYGGSLCNTDLSVVTYNISSTIPSLSKFYCKYQIPVPNTAPNKPILVRARVLITDIAQKIAVVPAAGGTIPGQAIIYTSKGTSGPTLRRLQLFTERNVVPFYFDFALFSTGSITK